MRRFFFFCKLLSIYSSSFKQSFYLQMHCIFQRINKKRMHWFAFLFPVHCSFMKFTYSHIFHVLESSPLFFQYNIQQLHILLVLLICQCTFHRFEVSIYGFTQFCLFGFFVNLRFACQQIIRNISFTPSTCIKFKCCSTLRR